MSDLPFLSVVIPVRNAAATLPEQLAALAAQEYEGRWEVVIVDNGSVDASVATAQTWADRLRSLRVVDASRRQGAAYARNVGAGAAAGDALAFCDADDVVCPGWLAALGAELRQSHLVAGRLDFELLNAGLPYRYDAPPSVHVHLGFLPAAASANLAVTRPVFEACNGFNEDHPGGGAEDVDFCWRAQLLGYHLAFSEQARVAYRLRPTVAAYRRQLRHYGRCDALLYRDFRRRGVPPAPTGQAIRAWAWVLVRLPWLRRSPEWDLWSRWIAYRFGRAVGSVRYRVLFL